MQQHNISNLLFTFEGRINRRQFWIGTLLTTVGALFTYLIAFAFLSPVFFSFFIYTTNAFLCLATICLGIKRLHDRNRSGWWFLLSCIPLFGTIWFIVEAGFFKGIQENNRFGDAPSPTISAVI